MTIKGTCSSEKNLILFVFTMLIIVVTLVVGVVNLVSSLSIVQKDNEVGITNITMLEENAKIPDNMVKERESKRDQNDENEENKELVEAAESNNLEYRPLFVYRRIQHTKRRITMYNSFAG